MRRIASTPPELPGYEYERLLGSGGFSDVFLYRQRLPRRPVAVKVLLVEESTPAARKAFVDEANLMAQLSAHPYIVTIYAADVTVDQRPYFVMEYCAGPSLSEQYKRERFPVADAVRTGVRLASAVATAHAAGILHRDIKPANVLTNAYGWPALTDFGISSTVEELPVHTTTSGALRAEADTGGTEGRSVGMSVPWSPPEMFEDDPDPDVRSDVFSLAATIWTLLAGRTPFEVPGRSNGTLELIGRIERGAVTAMDRDDVPASLIAVLKRGMAVHRADRYGSALELARALQRVELELGYTPTGIEVPSSGEDTGRDAGAGPADDAPETRVRGVATVVAQEPGGPATALAGDPAEDPASPPEAELQSTRVRGVTTVRERPLERTVARRDLAVERGSEPGSPPESTPGSTPAGAEAVQPASAVGPGRRRLTLTIVAVGAVVVVGAAVALSLVLTAGAPARPSASPAPSGSSAIVGGAPTAPRFLKATASADGTSVTFSFAPVDNAAGYRWAPSEQPDARSVVTTPTVVRTGVAPGQRVCVQVSTIATDGRTSEPTEACYP